MAESIIDAAVKADELVFSMRFLVPEGGVSSSLLSRPIFDRLPFEPFAARLTDGLESGAIFLLSLDEFQHNPLAVRNTLRAVYDWNQGRQAVQPDLESLPSRIFSNPNAYLEHFAQMVSIDEDALPEASPESSPPATPRRKIQQVKLVKPIAARALNARHRVHIIPILSGLFSQSLELVQAVSPTDFAFARYNVRNLNIGEVVRAFETCFPSRVEHSTGALSANDQLLLRAIGSWTRGLEVISTTLQTEPNSDVARLWQLVSDMGYSSLFRTWANTERDSLLRLFWAAGSGAKVSVRCIR
jgi:hypothetical protein